MSHPEDRMDGSSSKFPARKFTSKPLAAVLVALCLAAFGIYVRRNADERLADWTNAQAVPTVELAALKVGSSSRGLALPGELKPLIEAQIRARVNGYIKDWKYDIGARVNLGETLATIDAPEVDQQYEQAKGELARAEAHAQLAKLTSKRWVALRASTAVSQQSVDEKGGEVSAKDADVMAARANVDRLKAMKSFTDVTAPFSGIVTARRIDIGVLVGPGNPVELFDVADVHQMRVYVRVPQPLSRRIKQGMKATLTLSQFPGHTFEAKVIANSEAIAVSSRTLLVQLLADNKDGVLLPGSFVEVRFELPIDPNVIRIPATALVFKDNQFQIALVDPDSKVVLKKISIDRDLGTEVEVSEGVRVTDRVINYPSEMLRDGDLVTLITEKSNQARGDGRSTGARDE
jgi:RND family efflux transporter MFP subunit